MQDDELEPTDDEGEEVLDGDDAGDDTPDESDGTVTTGKGQPAKETFFNPSQIDALDVPDEVKAQLRATYKRMHGGYTKALQKTKGSAEAMNLVQRFNSDPDFAQQVLEARAKQLGLTIGKPGASAAQNGKTEGIKAPADLVESMREELPAEMQWMAPMMAKMFVLYQQKSGDPLRGELDQLKTERQRERDTQMSAAWETAEASMDEKYPLWREHEDDLLAVTEFIKSERLTHPRFGNKIELIYKLLNGDTIARGEVARRMSQGARNRVTTGNTSRVGTQNIAEMIRNAKTQAEKWELAGKYAAETHGIK